MADPASLFLSYSRVTPPLFLLPLKNLGIRSSAPGQRASRAATMFVPRAFLVRPRCVS
jgi:hypothetical protein